MNGIRTHLHVLLAAPALSLAGCAHAPMIDIGGSYFPSWMISLAMSIAFALGLRGFLRYRGIEDKISLLAVFYPGLVVLLACMCWLLLFR
jgi:hypothetical protein